MGKSWVKKPLNKDCARRSRVIFWGGRMPNFMVQNPAELGISKASKASASFAIFLRFLAGLGTSFFQIRNQLRSNY